MDKQAIISKAVDRYHKLDDILRSKMLKDEHAAFLQGRKFELMKLIYTLDNQAISRLTEHSVDTDPENVSVIRVMRFNPN